MQLHVRIGVTLLAVHFHKTLKKFTALLKITFMHSKSCFFLLAVVVLFGQSDFFASLYVYTSS